MTLLLSLIVLLPATPFNCRWGEKSALPPQASCGVPTRVRLPLPEGGKRFEFRRADNPNLSSYFHRRRDGRGPVKRFSNLINLYKVDIFLCPKDFDKPKTLLFKMISRSGTVKKMQCRLGPVGSAPVMATTMIPAMKSATMAPVMSAGATTAPAMSAPPKGMGKSVITNIVPPPTFRAAQNDPFARFLGLTAVVFTAIVMFAMALAIFLLRKRVVALERAQNAQTKTRELSSKET